MKKILTGLILLLLLFSGCERSEIEPVSLKGTLKGEVITLDEFGYKNDDNVNVVIQLEGSDPLISVKTDSAGKYEVKDIPSGTYNLTISKEGYSENQYQGIMIVGGIEALYFDGLIVEKSSTTIENLSLEILNSTIYMKGIVGHNYIIDELSNITPSIRYYIHTSSNPSDNNYIQTGTIRIKGDSGSQLDSEIYVNMDLFSSGSKIYIIAYGCYRYEYGYYDILLNLYRYSSLGTKSNIASITIP